MLQIVGKGGRRKEEAMEDLSRWIDECLDTLMYYTVVSVTVKDGLVGF